MRDSPGTEARKGDPLYHARKLLTDGRRDGSTPPGGTRSSPRSTQPTPPTRSASAGSPKNTSRDIFRADDPLDAHAISTEAIAWCEHPRCPARARHPGPHAAPLAHRNRNRRFEPHQQRSAPKQPTARIQRRQTISTRLPQPPQLPTARSCSPPCLQGPCQTQPVTRIRTDVLQLGCVEPLNRQRASDSCVALFT